MKRALLLTVIGLIVLLTACANRQEVSKATSAATQPSTSASTTAQETARPTSEPTQVQTLPRETVASVSADTPRQEQSQSDLQPDEEEQNNDEEQQEESEMTLQMMINNTTVSVLWEDNESVDALKELCKNEPLTIEMSMYGGFEQVGSIGATLPQNDVQTTTSAGDIVLYSGDQMVVFYGSNSWAYTRLGHISDQSPQELTQLLSNGNVIITLSVKSV